MTLTADRLGRFARHIVLPEVGGAGQVALSEAHVVLVGCGGIGSPVLQYLAAAGIGRLTLVDDDVVDVSNLQRQTIYTPSDIGRPKAEAAAEWVRRFVVNVWRTAPNCPVPSSDQRDSCCAAASATTSAAMLMMRRTDELDVRILTGALTPNRKGPTATLPPATVLSRL